MLASSLRGTVASSRMVVGETRARAEKALRRAVASLVASASSLATRTSTAPFLRARASILPASSATAAGWPSVSISSSASQSQRQADLGEIFDAMNRGAIEELERAGDDLRRDDVRDGLGGLVHLGECRHHGLLGGGFGDELEQDLA